AEVGVDHLPDEAQVPGEVGALAGLRGAAGPHLRLQDLPQPLDVRVGLHLRPLDEVAEVPGRALWQPGERPDQVAPGLVARVRGEDRVDPQRRPTGGAVRVTNPGAVAARATSGDALRARDRSCRRFNIAA